MKIQHHIDESTLLAFAAGNLSEAFSAVVSAHISWCPECQQKLHEMEKIGGALLNTVEPVDLEQETIDNLEQQFDLIMQSEALETADQKHDQPSYKTIAPKKEITCDILPDPITQLIGKPYHEVKWNFLAPGIQSYKIPLSHSSSGDLRLIKISPGHSMPEHGHHGAELTLVISGSYKDECGHFQRGDIADLDHETEHQPIVDSEQECICLFASEKPVKFKGLVPRLLQPIIGV